MKDAIVIKKISNFFYCFSDGTVYESKALGNLNKGNDSIVVGDHVKIRLNSDTETTAIILELKERKNMLTRPYIANVDMAIVVFSVKKPAINTFVIDSFLATIEKEKIEIIICFSKTDLDPQKKYLEILDIYKNIGYKIVGVSIFDNKSLDKLKELVHGKISVFAGPSGVGKSSIINSFSEEFDLETSEISNKLQRGKNTTTYAQLLKVSDNTYLADTPGFSSVKLEGVEMQDVKKLFIEFSNFSNKCRFSNSCLHYKEPGCAVKENVKNGRISKVRYDNYIKLLEMSNQLTISNRRKSWK